MRILYVVDARSPIAINWIEFFVQRKYEIHIVSTYPSGPLKGARTFEVIPVAFSGAVSTAPQRNRRQISALKAGSTIKIRTMLRQWLGPFTLSAAGRKLSKIVEQIQPNLIHAMRIPYEGMLTAEVETASPLLISVWGNDFTLHAPTTPMMSKYTRAALSKTNALHTDCFRDLRLAVDWGYSRDKPSIVLPGNGGVQKDLFYPPESMLNLKAENNTEKKYVELEKRSDYDYDISVINPRGFRAYVRNDVFFKSIPIILKQKPTVRFICPNMEGEPLARQWIQSLGISGHVDLLPKQSRREMAELYRKCRVFVSPSVHDGTPNTLLEAMACGCTPVAGDIESLREWITPGVNGLLFDPSDPDDLAKTVLTALDQSRLHENAREINADLIAQRADYYKVMEEAGDFYSEFRKN